MDELIKCDWCSTSFPYRERAKYTNSSLMNMKFFCSRRCQEDYRNKEKDLHKEYVELEAEKNRKKEIRRDESRRLREERKEDFKKDFNTVRNLFKNNSNNDLPVNKNSDEVNDASDQEPEKTSSWLSQAIMFVVIIVLIKLFVRIFG